MASASAPNTRRFSSHMPWGRTLDRKLSEQLRRINSNSKTINEWVNYPRLKKLKLPPMSQRALCELRSMRIPPTEVHQLVRTVFVTLGFNDADGWTWKQCSSKMAKKCWDNLLSRFDPRAVPRSTVIKAQRRLAKIDINVTQQSNMAAFTLYSWIGRMLQQLLELNE